MRKKTLFLLIVIIVIVIFVGLLLLKVPIKSAQNVEFGIIPYHKVTKYNKKIICQYSDSTGPRWMVIGIENKLFDLNVLSNPLEYIILEGNYPKTFINSDLLYSSEPNRFIFEGEYIGEEKYDDGGTYKVFKVSRWSLSSPINRRLGLIDNLPSESLVGYDFLPFK